MVLKFPPASSSGGGGAPTDAHYLVTSSNPNLTGAVVVSIPIPVNKGGTGTTSLAGSNEQILFNDSGVMGTDSGFLFTKATKRLQVDGPVYATNGFGIPSVISSYLGTTANFWAFNQGAPAVANMVTAGDNQADGDIWVLNRCRSTLAAPTIVQNGDYLGGLQWKGWTGSGGGFRVAAQLACNLDGAPVANTGKIPGSLSWLCTDVNGVQNEGLFQASTGALTAKKGLLTLPISASTVPLTVQGTSSQSANLQEWKNNTPAIVANLNNNGDLGLLGSLFLPSNPSAVIFYNDNAILTSNGGGLYMQNQTAAQNINFFVIKAKTTIEAGYPAAGVNLTLKEANTFGTPTGDPFLECRSTANAVVASITSKGGLTLNGESITTDSGIGRALILGTTSDSARVIFQHVSDSAKTWEIDGNDSGLFRWFNPGVLRMSLNTSGVLTLTGNLTSPKVIVTGDGGGSPLLVTGDSSAAVVRSTNNSNYAEHQIRDSSDNLAAQMVYGNTGVAETQFRDCALFGVRTVAGKIKFITGASGDVRGIIETDGTTTFNKALIAGPGTSSSTNPFRVLTSGTDNATGDIKAASNVCYAGFNCLTNSDAIGGSFSYANSNVAETALRDTFFLGPRTAAGKLLLVTGTAADVKMTMETNGNTTFVGTVSAPNMPKVLTSTLTAVGNVTTGEDDLISYSVPGATMANNGDVLEVTAFGIFAANTNLKQVKLKFGGTTLYATGSVLINGGYWEIRASLVRIGGTTQIATASFNGNVAVVTATSTYSEPGETLSGGVTLKCTGEATATDDIIQKGLIVKYLPKL